jgi:polysaccharide biosynthesis protein PslH
MRLVLICNEAPFPATHGGRVDVWRRLCAMRAAGAEIFLVFWSGDRSDELPREAALARMNQEVSDLAYFVIPRTTGARLKRFSRLARWPSHVASRVLDSADHDSLLARLSEFAPDAVWLESIYGGVIATEVADQFKVPLFCRSHNIEHLYMEKQVQKAVSVRDRIVWSLNLLHLKDFECSVLRKSARFFDISQDDLEFWKRAGFSNGEWLPPMIDAEFAAQLSAPILMKPEYDVGYLGNLFSPNNVNGILWFLNEVVPKLRSEKPEIRIFISGSKPVDLVVQTTSALGVKLIASPDDVVPVLRNAHVLVNPVFAGSGVNIKSVEMLFCPAEIVSTSQGLAGLPTEVTQHFRCADSADSFSTQILDALDHTPPTTTIDRAGARALFSFERARGLISSLNSISACAQAKSRGCK